MTVVGFVGLLARNWLLCLTCAALGTALAILAALFVVPPSYSAAVQLYVSGAGGSADDRLKNGEYARTHVASYAEMINSNDVLEAVRANLGLPRSSAGGYDDLADDISASNPLGTLIIDVTVQDSSPERAQAVAAAIGKTYNSVVARIESAATQQQSPVRINVVSNPALPTKPVSPSIKLYAAIGFLIGTTVGTGAAWLLELRRTRRPAESATGGAPGQHWPWWPDGTSGEAGHKQENFVARSVQSTATSNGSSAKSVSKRRPRDHAPS